jgi:hypothetical protein
MILFPVKIRTTVTILAAAAIPEQVGVPAICAKLRILQMGTAIAGGTVVTALAGRDPGTVDTGFGIRAAFDIETVNQAGDIKGKIAVFQVGSVITIIAVLDIDSRAGHMRHGIAEPLELIEKRFGKIEFTSEISSVPAITPPFVILHHRKRDLLGVLRENLSSGGRRRTKKNEILIPKRYSPPQAANRAQLRRRHGQLLSAYPWAHPLPERNLRSSHLESGSAVPARSIIHKDYAVIQYNSTSAFSYYKIQILAIESSLSIRREIKLLSSPEDCGATAP